MSTTRGIIPADYDNDDAAHFAVGYLSSAIKGFLDGHHDVDLLRSSYEKLTASLDERDRRRPVPAVSQLWDQAMQEADGPVYPVPAVSEQEAHVPHLWTLTTIEDEKYRTDPDGRWQVWLKDEQRWADSIHASKEAMEAIGHQFRSLDGPAEEATPDA